MLADNTETAQQLSESGEILNFTRSRTGGEYQIRSLPNKPDNKYIILVDGMSDMNYVIQSVKWSTLMAPQSIGEVNHTSTISVDGEIELFEPYGFKFMKLIADSCSALDADPVGLVFVLKTIFVGHTHEGTTENIVTIKPLMFWLYDIQTATTETGTVYNLSFVSISDGVAKFPQISNIGQGVSVHILKGQTLREAFQEFENRINQIYQYRRKKFEEKYQDKIQGLSDLKDVEYKIILDDAYDSSYIAGDNTKESQQTTGDDDPVIRAGKKASIEAMIDTIMRSSSKVLREGDSENKKVKYYYKVSSTVDSSGEKFIVKFKITRHKLIVDTLEAQKVGELDPENGRTIEFNYIYTGKNVDIIDFDMKMEMALSFLQAVLTSDSLPDGKQTLAKGTDQKITGKGNATAANPAPKLRKNVPLFIGSFSDDALTRNITNNISAEAFNNLVDKYAFLNNVEVSMTIAGNPQLMADLMVIPEDINKEQQLIPGVTVAADWQSAPPYVKVNIKTPADPNQPGGPFEDFWYTGYYRLFEVNNIFGDDGIFKQELTMFSIPQTDPSTTDKDPVKSNTVNEDSASASSSPTSGDAVEQSAQDRKLNLQYYAP